MLTEKVIKVHKRCIAIAKLIEKKRSYLQDLESKMKIELNKDYLDSFSTVPKSWYVQQIEKTHFELTWMDVRYFGTIKELGLIF